MVADFFAVDATIRTINQQMGVTRLGWSALDILQAAQNIGLKGKALRVEALDDLAHLDRPVILHWCFNHYVVLIGATTDGAWIIDPAAGRRWVPRDQLDGAFTGIVLWFERAEFLEKGRTRRFAVPNTWHLALHSVRQTRLLGQMLFVAAACQAVALLPALIAGIAFGRLAQGQRAWLYILFIAVALFVAAHHHLGLVKGYLLSAMRARIQHSLGEQLFDRVIRGDFAQLAQRTHAETMARVVAADALTESLAGAGAGVVLEALLVLLGILAIAVLQPQLALLIAGLIAVGTFLQLHLTGHRRRRMEAAFSAQAESRALMSQAISGAETIRAMGGQDWASTRWGEAFSRDVSRSSALSRSDARLTAFQETFMLGSGLVGAVAVSGVAAYGLVSVAEALAGYTLVMLLLASTSRLFGHLNALAQATFQAARVLDLVSINCESSGQLGERWALHAPPQISVQNLSFRYFVNAPNAVDCVSLEIPAGALVVLLGESGSGKSTLLSLLGSVQSPQAGTISADSRDVTSLDRYRSSRPLLLVPQFPFLFNGSVRENIALGAPAATLDRVIDAAKSALIHDDITVLPMGYETILGDNGTGLSGGQRQRIALARALLCQPGVLLLDESTSALDARLEQLLFERIRATGATVIFATHRSHLAISADQTIVMQKGRVVYHGPYSPEIHEGTILNRSQIREETE